MHGERKPRAQAAHSDAVKADEWARSAHGDAYASRCEADVRSGLNDPEIALLAQVSKFELIGHI